MPEQTQRVSARERAANAIHDTHKRIVEAALPEFLPVPGAQKLSDKRARELFWLRDARIDESALYASGQGWEQVVDQIFPYRRLVVDTGALDDSERVARAEKLASMGPPSQSSGEDGEL